MTTQPVSFFRHVHKSLSPYRWGTAILVSLSLAFAFLTVSVANRTSSDRQILTAISPYLSSLLESQDRPEILRVLHSVSDQRGSALALIQNNIVVASTRDISEMDRPFSAPAIKLSVLGGSFTQDQIVSSIPVHADRGGNMNASVYLFTPLGSTIFNALAISAAAFLLSLVISFFSAVRMKRAVKSALRPIEQLHHDIQRIGDDGFGNSKPIPIRELEGIRETIAKAKLDLANTRESLAEERAKQLNAESYKRLIHDLHNPIAALRGQIKLISNPTTGKDVRDEAQESVPRIADQILNQVTAAKRNLENQTEALRESDIRKCLRDCSEQMNTLLSAKGGKSLTLSLPDTPVMVPHDPTLLNRAVLNLLENGIEASHKQVELSLESTDDQALIRVSDDGDGIDESNLSVYLQGRGLSSKADRQAFGLSSVNHIVRTHGGKVVYKRSALGGAAFEIRLGIV